MTQQKHEAKAPQTESPRDVELVFRPTAMDDIEIQGFDAEKGLRVRLEEVMAWFKGYRVKEIELWVEGAVASGKLTQLIISAEGKGGCKVTLIPPTA